jgi:hypothetical protein
LRVWIHIGGPSEGALLARILEDNPV